jgi:hypothetical protein
MPRWRLLAGLGLAGLIAAHQRDQLIGVLFGNPGPYRVQVTRAIALPMPDGVLLRADHYAPTAPGPFPTLVQRTPYGRWGTGPLSFALIGELSSRWLASHGYHVILQVTRGRFDSDGHFTPLVDERADGLASLDWCLAQPWCDGRLGMFGASYMGYTQWAAADHPRLRAIVPHITNARADTWVYPQGAFALEARLRWAATIAQIDSQHPGRPATSEARLRAAFRHLPLLEADSVALGRPEPFFRDWLSRPPGDPSWEAYCHAGTLASAPPAHLIGGWYDYMLGGQLQDYADLRAAGHTPYLTIGPWIHGSLGSMRVGLLESLAWLNAHLKGDRRRLRHHPVRIFVMGARRWRAFAHWPPPATARRLFLVGAGALADAPATESPPDHYHYDPLDPTPVSGGALLGTPNGPQDQRALEARADVLTYTSAPLTQPLEVIGPVRLELYARSSLTYTDFVGRLCVVEPDGRSMNLCEGLVRLGPGTGTRRPDGVLQVTIDFWATAYRFRPGQRIRLQVASGAHPRWARNHGTGEPVASAAALAAGTQTIYHDREYPSALVLPILE